MPGLGYISIPVGPTSNLDQVLEAVIAAKTAGWRVHIAIHHDGQGAQYAYWPYTNGPALVALNAALAAKLAGWLTAQDTWENTNEPNANPALGSTWAQQIPLFETGGTLPQARDAVRGAGVKAIMLFPVPGSQDPQEAVNVVTAGELPLSYFQGWDGISGHFYAEAAISAVPGPGVGQLFSQWAGDFQTLADKVNLPWVATEYGWGNNTPSGPAALFAMRSLLELFAVVGTNIGGIVWQLRNYDQATSIGGNPAALAAVGGVPTMAAAGATA